MLAFNANRYVRIFREQKSRDFQQCTRASPLRLYSRRAFDYPPNPDKTTYNDERRLGNKGSEHILMVQKCPRVQAFHSGVDPSVLARFAIRTWLRTEMNTAVFNCMGTYQSIFRKRIPKRWDN
jgi:hypothetical protein